MVVLGVIALLIFIAYQLYRIRKPRLTAEDHARTAQERMERRESEFQARVEKRAQNVYKRAYKDCYFLD